MPCFIDSYTIEDASFIASELQTISTMTFKPFTYTDANGSTNCGPIQYEVAVVDDKSEYVNSIGSIVTVLDAQELIQIDLSQVGPGLNE